MTWVKVHIAVLSDPDYSLLTENQRLTWLELLALCGRTQRPLPLNSRWIGSQLSRDSRAIGRALPALLSNNFIELCERTQNLFGELPPPREEYIEDIEREDKTPPLSPSENDLNFEEFWKLYPRLRRGSKTKAFSAWNTARQRDSPGSILSGLRDYAASDEVRDGYAKGAAAWLNDDRWTTDYRTFRKPTAEDLREEFINGDQGGDLGRGTIDGQCVEVSGGGSEADGGSVSFGLERLERQSGSGLGEQPAVELDEDGPAKAGRRADNRCRVDALIAEVTKATKARA